MSIVIATQLLEPCTTFILSVDGGITSELLQARTACSDHHLILMVVSTELLEEENRATDVSAVQKARDFYMSCVNEGTCEQSRLLRELRHAEIYPFC